MLKPAKASRLWDWIWVIFFLVSSLFWTRIPHPSILSGREMDVTVWAGWV